MFKVLLQLIVVLFLSAVLGQQFILPTMNEQLFNKQIDWTIQFISKGTIDLVAKEVNNVDKANYRNRINELQPLFGFEIDLIELVTFSEQQKEELLTGDLSTNVETASVFKLLNDQSSVLAFEQIETAASHITSEAQWRIMGTIKVLKMQLIPFPERDWPTQISTLSELFKFAIKVVEIDSLTLSEEKMSRLASDQIVWLESASSKELEFPLEFAYSKIQQSDKVLVIGPIAEPIMDKIGIVYLKYYFIFSLIILLPVILWILPTWISLKRLSKASKKLGQGDFSARSPIVRGSNINRSIQIFNNMANKIQGLITVNKSLVNAVSHELRTPLSRIEFDLELARNSNEDVERDKIHDRIESSVDELKTLVSEMLVYAKFDQEKPELTLEQVDLNHWLHNEIEPLQLSTHAKDLILVANPLTQLTKLDRYYMSRVVTNLVGNAIKYADNKVRISSGYTQNTNFISVEDDGLGIAEADRIRAFDAFVRLDKSRNRNTGGTGLGLAIVKQIVLWHHGTIEISDSKLGGAKFTLYWPN